MSSVLKIGGTTITRSTAHVILNRLTFSLDRPDELEFTELSAVLPGTFTPEQTVSLTINGTPAFTGWIFSRSPSGMGSGPITIGYRALGLRYGAQLIAITAADGTGSMVFNLPSTDPNYSANFAGQSIGAILTTVFNQHATQLTSYGITSFNVGDLAALTVVPPDPTYFQGNMLWSQVDQLLQQWYGSRYASYITPAGVIRVFDTTALTAETFTLDSDPVILTAISEDTSECYTQVCLRGRDNVEPAYLSLHDGTLAEGWTGGQQSSWTQNQFLYPVGAYDIGSITAVTASTATVKSDNAALTWGVNFWSGILAQIAVINPITTTITGFEYRHVTANTALSAGGTSVITFDRPLVNSGYTRYQLRGEPGGESVVWRKYTIPNTYVAQHLVQQFNFAVPWMPAQNVVAQTNFPTSVVTYTSAGLTTQFPMTFEVIPYDGVNNGYILFYQPVVFANNSQSALNAGGSSVTAPVDVQVLLAYSRGTLQAIEPLSGGSPTYSGTAYTLYGIQRTLYRDYPSWIDAGNLTMMQTLASNILATVSNVVVEGSLTYFGQYTTVFITSGTVPLFPISINIAKATGTTGYEAIAAPCRTLTLEWPQSGATPWITRFQFSTRRQQYSGDRLYVHPNYSEGPGWFGSSSIAGGIAYGGQGGFDQSIAGTIAPPAFNPVQNAQQGFQQLGQQAQQFNPVTNAQQGFQQMAANLGPSPWEAARGGFAEMNEAVFGGGLS
jgi:hypothetical protein